MEFLSAFADYFIHLDKHLNSVIQNYGSWIYFLLFVIIFCETGLLVTPFLPGDSLLFAVGAFAAVGELNLALLISSLSFAAILGDSVNYSIGHYIGPKIFKQEKSWFFNPEHLKKTHSFYEKYGAKTIVLARFVPIVRTFAPCVAGVGTMSYEKFLFYNIVGGFLWVLLCVCSGYFFGNMDFVKNNFEWVILAIIFISLLPMILEYVKYRLDFIKK